MCTIFLKRKYPENWDEALRWVNYSVLRPAGDKTHLEELIKDIKRHDQRNYHYQCKEEPVCGRCNARACRLEPYGVGNDQHPERVDFGITVLKTVPVVYFVGEARMQLTADELYNQQRFHIKCMEHRVSTIIY